MRNVINKVCVGLERNTISKKTLVVVFVILFILSLVPLIVTMFYSVPQADDYTFGRSAHLSINNGNGLMNGVWESFSRFYNGWQGFFTTNFIASIQPYVFNEDLYYISNISFFSVLIISLFYFAKVLLINIISLSKSEYLLVSIPIVVLFTQFMPSAAEGIYWMDGSLAMLITGLVLLLISLIIRYDYTRKKRSKVILFALTLILSAICSGAIIMDFVTLLQLFVFAIIYCIKKKRNLCPLLIANFAVLTIGVLISVLAPGNAARADLLSGFSLPKSIAYALLSSCEWFGKWFSISFVVVLLFVSVIVWNRLKNSSYSFKNPVLVFVGMYSIYAGRMSVQFYAGGYLGSPRQMNQYFIAFIICMTFSWLYFVGWMSKKELFRDFKFNHCRINTIFCLLVAFVFAAGGLGYGYKNLNSVSTSISLAKGQTQQYNEEMKERIKMYNDSTLQVVKVKPLTYYPVFFLGEPLSEDPEYWENSSVAAYYGKESVVLIREGENNK